MDLQDIACIKTKYDGMEIWQKFKKQKQNHTEKYIHYYLFQCVQIHFRFTVIPCIYFFEFFHTVEQIKCDDAGEFRACDAIMTMARYLQINMRCNLGEIGIASY